MPGAVFLKPHQLLHPPTPPKSSSSSVASHPSPSVLLSRTDSMTATFTPKFFSVLNANARDTPPTVAESARDLAEFSGKRWVWFKDDKLAFVKGYVTQDNGDGTLQVR